MPAVKPSRKTVLFVIKLLLTTSLTLFLLWKADWGSIWRAIHQADPILLSVVFCCMVFCVTLSAVKWRVLLSIHGISIPLRVLQRYYFVALFFNNVLPSNVGGDFYRIYKTLENQRCKSGAVIAVFLERISGIWALLTLGLLSGVVLLCMGVENTSFFKTVTIFFAVGVIAPMLFTAFIYMFSDRGLLRMKFIPKLNLIHERMDDFRRHPGKVSQTLILSFFFHVFSLSWMILLLSAIGTELSVFALTVTITISNLAAVLPLSINGIGLLDGSFIYVAGLFGMDFNYALTFMLLMRSMTLIISLIGGIYYLKDKKSEPANEVQEGNIRSKEVMQ